MIFKMCTGRNSYQLVIYTLWSWHQNIPIGTHQRRVKKVSVDTPQEAYSVAHSMLHHKMGNTLFDGILVWGTKACSRALSFLRHFRFIDGICAALFSFIYNAVQIMLKMKTVLIKWRSTVHWQSSPHYKPHTTRTTHGASWITLDICALF